MGLIKVKTPAKINLTLEVKKDETGDMKGFHEIQSIMSAVNLYDFLTFEIEDASFENEIYLSGNNPQIPYDKRNLVYKAIEIFCETLNIKNKKFKVNIEKHIPVEAGLAGGSTNAAGTLFALNKFFDAPLSDFELNELCAKLGSDLNFCLNGGCAFCEGRGEKVTPLPSIELPVSLIKPKNFGISTKEAYQKFDKLNPVPETKNTKLLKSLILKGEFDEKLIVNHLESAIINDYPVLKKIKMRENAFMSGSGPTMIKFSPKVDTFFGDDVLVIEGLKTIPDGIKVI